MEKLEKRIKRFLQERGWNHLRPSDLAKSIMIEGAELLELFQWENLELEKVRRSKELVDEVKKELADVLIYAIQMAVLLDIDTAGTVNRKLDYVEKKYPAELMRKNAKKGSGSGRDAEYWRIKKKKKKKGP
ncbi:MAG: nucleotide pyrophosphohydrolase [Candidatus Sungbacteria bacterium]|nr:nucleotide pyrophosphohydrolase [Candidatus Sungbacteria bacterium]